ncbi:MAG: aminotransferase class III-fold pyridoxal phosphate-dependent enzyme [Phycisphaerales bacterium]
MPAPQAAPAPSSSAPSPARPAADGLVGPGFLASDVVARHIDAIVGELAQRQAAITGARPARAELKASFDEWMARNAEVRGKTALFPYIGTGVGNGPLVELLDGSVKWDMINGIGVHMFGHSDPETIRAAIVGSLSDTVQQGNLQFNADSILFAETLVAEASRTSRLRHAFVTNSGCMANESALKVCFQKNAPASRVLAFQDCFMGRSTTMAQIGDSAAGRVGIPLNTLVDYMPFYDPEHGERSIEYACWHLRQNIARYPGQYACFVMELVQGEGGFNQAPREFFEALCRICRENRIAVWFDEVQTFGRTERMYHFEQLGLGEYVDVLTLGKMSQACACLYTADYNPKPGLLSGTFIGGSVELQVGRRALERLRDGGYYSTDAGEGRIAKLQRAFREHAAALVKRHPALFPPVPHTTGRPSTKTPVYGGVGGMMRLTPFGGDRAKVMKALHVMFDEGVVAFYCGHGPYHVRFLPPVGVMKPEQFAEVFPIVERALLRVE